MLLLSIETVGRTGSVAALDGEALLAEIELDAARRSAQTLAPAIAELLDRVGWRPADVGLVAVATGPGSFTGLRIGVTTAKTFAYAVGCEVVGVPTLLAIAAQAPVSVTNLKVVLDAERGELFAAGFARDPIGALVETAPTAVVNRDAWLASLVARDTVTGPAVESLVDRVPQGVIVVDRALWAPHAPSIGRIGLQLHTSGQRTTVFDLVPNYFRKTAAEERADQRAAAERRS